MVINRKFNIYLLVVLLLSFTLVPAAPVHASMGCTGSTITINEQKPDWPHAENPREATGHRHSSGDHYIRYTYSDGALEWWADNGGGWDGDTWDTFYGKQSCQPFTPDQ